MPVTTRSQTQSRSVPQPVSTPQSNKRTRRSEEWFVRSVASFQTETDNEMNDLLNMNTTIDGLYVLLSLENITIKKDQPIRDYVKAKWNHMIENVSNQARSLLVFGKNENVYKSIFAVLDIVKELRPILLRVFPDSPASVNDIDIIVKKIKEIQNRKNFFDTF